MDETTCLAQVLYTAEFDDDSKTQIFSALVDWWFGRFKYNEAMQDLRGALVSSSIGLYG